MSRSASRLEDEPSPLGELARAALHAAGTALARNPGAVAGGTAFIVALSFISANALWNQQQPHTTTFFVTRETPAAAVPLPDEEPPAVEETASVDHVDPPAAELRGDPMVEQVQQILTELDLYAGSVDGIAGPQTRKAVEDYRKLVGLDPSGEIDEMLLQELSNRRAEGTDVPVPQARPSDPAGPSEQGRTDLSHDEIVRVQAGLKAFGHDGIEIDGVVGLKTRGAIREFQSLFGQPVTGEPNAALIEKMREIGLTN